MNRQPGHKHSPLPGRQIAPQLPAFVLGFLPFWAPALLVPPGGRQTPPPVCHENVSLWDVMLPWYLANVWLGGSEPRVP